MSFKFSSVPDVLSACYCAEVGPAIVQAVVVDVVAEHAIRNINNKIVHIGVFSRLFFAICERVYGIAGAGAFAEVPFVLHQPVVIFGVNYGEFASCQGDFSKGIAEAQPAIQEQDED